MYAKKSLGQHFLKSERALKVIVEAGEIKEGDLVLEIGPGTGTLTEKLLEKAGNVIAVEKDDELFDKLKEKFKDKLELVHQDILDYDPPIDRYKLVANIPYNITGAILQKFLSAEHQPERIVLLVQKDVAERIVAKDKKESILSISVKVYGQPKFIERVLAGSFAPAPKVDSAILLIENISKDFFVGFTEVDFFALLRAGFQAKRKKLSSNLSQKISKDKVLAAFQDLALDTNIRAEDLSLQNWQDLASKLI